MKKSATCGVCGTLKVQRRDRLVCQECSRRYSREYAARVGSKAPTAITRATKARYRNKVRTSGFTNQKVYSLKKRYGLQETEYAALREAQDGLCAICRELLTADVLVDHDHRTGTIRGLLCRPCNFALGLFKDDPLNLRSAAAYLERHQGVTREA